MFSRRQFILRTSSFVSLSPLAPSMFCEAARAATDESDGRVLVVIQLDGGNDGLNTVVPYADEGYAKARVKLRLETNKLHKLNDHVGLHPQMRSAKALFDDGRLAIVQGVGYPNPDRSHFRSMRIWQTACMDRDSHKSYGWIGQSLDGIAADNRNGEASAIYVGDDEAPVALWGRRSTATVLSRGEDLSLDRDLSEAFSLASPKDAKTSDAESTQQVVTREVLSAYVAAKQFRQQDLAGKETQTGIYPDNALAQQLSLVSKMLKSGSQARVFYTSQSGYDTHASQLYTHANLLGELSSALKAFLDDLKTANLDDRVLVFAFSEFGRRVKENDSQGTDHGAAGPVFLAGRAVKAGVHGKTPSFADLDDGDLKASIDFRSVYATVVDEWLKIARPKSLSGFGAIASIIAA